MKIFIAMPLGKGQMQADTAASIFGLQNALIKHGFETTFNRISFTDVAKARDILADQFLAGGADKLLFVDDDMAFEPSIILEMIKFDKAFVGVLCPQKTFDFEAFGKAYAEGADKGDKERLRTAKTAGLRFVGKLKADAIEDPSAMFQPAVEVGTGVLLLDRSVFEQLIAEDKTLKRPFNGLVGRQVYSFFERLVLSDNQLPLSEDLSFNYRWRKHIGGEIWAYARGGVGHIGDMTYEGSPPKP